MIATGEHLGINKFLLIQWVAPLAGEAPEIIFCVLFTLSLKPRAALGALISDKINQWTLLVGFIPLFYSIGAGKIGSFPLDARRYRYYSRRRAAAKVGRDANVCKIAKKSRKNISSVSPFMA